MTIITSPRRASTEGTRVLGCVAEAASTIRLFYPVDRPPACPPASHARWHPAPVLLAVRRQRTACYDLPVTMAQRHTVENLGTWKVLLQLARPYQKRFIIIALLALLGTGADLLRS